MGQSDAGNAPEVGRPRGAAWRGLQSEGVVWEGQVAITGVGADLAARLIITKRRMAFVRGGAIALEIQREWLQPPPTVQPDGAVQLAISADGNSGREAETINVRAREGRIAAIQMASLLAGGRGKVLGTGTPVRVLDGRPTTAKPRNANRTGQFQPKTQPGSRPSVTTPTPAKARSTIGPAALTDGRTGRPLVLGSDPKPPTESTTPRPEGKTSAAVRQPSAWSTLREQREPTAPDATNADSRRRRWFGSTATPRETTSATRPPPLTSSLTTQHGTPALPAPSRPPEGEPRFGARSADEPPAGAPDPLASFRPASLAPVLPGLPPIGPVLERSIEPDARLTGVGAKPTSADTTSATTPRATKPTPAPIPAPVPMGETDARRDVDAGDASTSSVFGRSWNLPPLPVAPLADLDRRRLALGGAVSTVAVALVALTIALVFNGGFGGRDGDGERIPAGGDTTTTALIVDGTPTADDADRPTVARITNVPPPPGIGGAGTRDGLLGTPGAGGDEDGDASSDGVSLGEVAAVATDRATDDFVAPTATQTPQPPTRTPTAVPTATNTPEPPATATATATATVAPTQTPTVVPTATATATATAVPTATNTPEPPQAPTQVASVAEGESPRQVIASGPFRITIEATRRGYGIPEINLPSSVWAGEWLLLVLYVENWTNEPAILDMSGFGLSTISPLTQPRALDSGNSDIGTRLGFNPRYGSTSRVEFAAGEGDRLSLLFLLPEGAQGLILSAGPTVIDLERSFATTADLVALGPLPVLPDLVAARVVQVIDGQTIRVEVDGATVDVRYAGVTAPTGDACFAAEASATNAEFVEDETVLIERQHTASDAQGQWVRDVWVPDGMGGRQLVSQLLLVRGVARTTLEAPNTRFAGWLVTTEIAAAQNGGGLWSACASEG